MSWGITTGMQIVISTEEQTASDELRKKIIRQAARSKKQTDEASSLYLTVNSKKRSASNELSTAKSKQRRA